jgi:hypothetical protein
VTEIVVHRATIRKSVDKDQGLGVKTGGSLQVTEKTDWVGTTREKEGDQWEGGGGTER